LPDNMKMFFGSQSCSAESQGTYATVPDILYIPGMMGTALWSLWQLPVSHLPRRLLRNGAANDGAANECLQDDYSVDPGASDKPVACAFVTTETTARHCAVVRASVCAMLRMLNVTLCVYACAVPVSFRL
jgi:hypothetical protein